MDLIDRYLNAVAAQLPQSERADIIAELRDMILSRFEEKEEALGRPLTEAEQEDILRDVGHPLAVAARYGSGPQHIVGPELYPWWMFAVRAGLIAIVAITVLGAIVRVVVGDVEAGRAIGQAFHSIFNGAISLIGFATVGAYIIERQKEKPRFLREWRVKDLGLFEFGGNLNAEAVSRGLSEGDWSAKPAGKGKARAASPTVRALGSAVGWGVILLWWVGWLPLTHTTPEDLGAVVHGVDFGRMLAEMHGLLYWPVIAFALVRIAFDLTRALHPKGVRFTALGDIGFGLAEAALFVWVWLYSPMSPIVFVPDVESFLDRVRAMIETGWWPLPGILMLCVAFGFLIAASKVVGALGRLVTGRDRRLIDASN
ncbi:HAAS signaling domain-containing protein [Brevundimonas sp. FT23028]|uniref:HAAS signaling domain-containing protein n=1 Tax=Brevundimonas sp. FT23028 TaxID=3393748 RepID=UPI003B586151